MPCWFNWISLKISWDLLRWTVTRGLCAREVHTAKSEILDYEWMNCMREIKSWLTKEHANLYCFERRRYWVSFFTPVFSKICFDFYIFMSLEISKSPWDHILILYLAKIWNYHLSWTGWPFSPKCWLKCCTIAFSISCKYKVIRYL
jgi:hypothetical protein